MKLLFVEDNADDLELELYELRRNCSDVCHVVARNREEFFACLDNLDVDIIIADYSLPDLTGIEVIHICQERNIDVPVILITGAGNEQIAVDSLREGAVDYILKKNIAGFSARVLRAMDIAADRKAIAAARAEKERLQQQLFQAQKMETVGRLAGGIAHDFNNILTGIIGYAAVATHDLPKDSHIREYLRAIVGASERASNLIKQLLLFSRKIPLQFGIVNVNSLIEENVSFIRRMVEETVDIRLDLADDLPAIRFDESQLAQVLINFAVNSRDAMHGKGVLVFKTELYHYVVKPAYAKEGVDADQYICISVQDSGCGIDAKDVDKIFEPFFTTKEVGKGTGLGLSVVYSIVTAHDGWIDVDSAKGEGTTFRVYLPVRAQDAPASNPSCRGPEGQENLRRGRETILVVEDEDLLRLFTSDMLKKLGYKVLTARNGVEALGIYGKQGAGIDLVLSDNIMPKKSGIELFHDLRGINPEIKFILSTGYCLDEKDGRFLREMAAILMKPYKPEKLVSFIRRVLDG